MAMTHDIETYLAEGCGRCALGGTPQCKVHTWEEELKQLRRIVLDCELTEEVKWGVPCYTFQNKNILIVSAFKEYCAINFFKGALLLDAEGLLQKPGENTQEGRLIRFTNVQEIIQMENILKAYIYEAMEVERLGLKIEVKEKPVLVYPEELVKILAENTDLKMAFEALTPGRQKGYLLHFASPKQSSTRVSRIEKCIPKIFTGKGVNEY